MATLLSFLNYFAPKASRTATAPNTYAVVSLWKKFFALKEEEYEEQLEMLKHALESEVDHRELSPISCDEVSLARAEFLREYYHQLVTGAGFIRRVPSASASTTPATDNNVINLLRNMNESRTQQQLQNPDFQVPVAPGSTDYMYLAQ